jgi:hypothetical protein
VIATAHDCGGARYITGVANVIASARGAARQCTYVDN